MFLLHNDDGPVKSQFMCLNNNGEQPSRRYFAVLVLGCDFVLLFFVVVFIIDWQLKIACLNGEIAFSAEMSSECWGTLLKKLKRVLKPDQAGQKLKWSEHKLRAKNGS